ESLGIDSILVSTIMADLQRQFGPLPETLLYEHATIRALAEYFVLTHAEALVSVLGSGAVPEPGDANGGGGDGPERRNSELAAASRVPALPVSEATDIAIVGIAGRYPGARNLQEFWDKLKRGLDLVREIPAARWDHQRYFNGSDRAPFTTPSKWGGFLDDVE